MPFKDPEAKREANKLRMRKRRAEGAAWIDPEKEAARKAVWYYEQGGKVKRLESDRRRAVRLKEDRIGDITG